MKRVLMAIATVALVAGCAQDLDQQAAWLAKKRAEIEASCTAAGFDLGGEEHYECRHVLALQLTEQCPQGKSLRWGCH